MINLLYNSSKYQCSDKSNKPKVVKTGRILRKENVTFVLRDAQLTTTASNLSRNSPSIIDGSPEGKELTKLLA
jgi:hypothetical protein